MKIHLFTSLGVEHGRHRRAIAATSGDPIDSANSTDMGAGPRAYSFKAGRYRTIEDAGIRAGEIIAYRAWKLTPEGFLRGMFNDYDWKPDAIEGPADISWWGLHAFKTLRQAVSQYEYCSVNGTVIFGTVALWGEVIEHERGYRAEFSKIVALNCSRRFILSPLSRLKAWRQLRTARKRYNVVH